MKNNNYEAQEQTKLIQWAALNTGKYPELDLLHHIPNGGSRHKLEAINLKRQGVKAGVPDLCLPVPKSEYHGLWIELKSKSGRLQGKEDEKFSQKWWLKQLSERGYKTVVCYGFDEAVEVLLEYLRG